MTPVRTTAVLTPDAVLDAVRRNPVNVAILERLPDLGAPQAQLVAGCVFGAVWNAQAGLDATAHVRDYDVFYFDPDTGYGAEDEVIRRAGQLFADLGVTVEVRNQARVHLWFESRFGQTRPAIGSVREGIDQFLVRCTCLGVDAAGTLYAPYGLQELAAGVLRPNPLNADDGTLYRAKVDSYRARWPWLRDDAGGPPGPLTGPPHA
ncbi:nucleotidyltransferase family protein [Deinococcus aquiradiocola]|uniref:Nucleotidyltransferase family protein n=1 Tax=Deinococcus aquiradiocola TaxID=393059 RepID=A0A917PRK1_9DEIO|nr:nucleotidyltransferase family protein [Deinococcus aquiradiocola]GGJ88407.1 hypothetical protein GCM10008939_35620 [Deinococcus aquiradiocola]